MVCSQTLAGVTSSSSLSSFSIERSWMVDTPTPSSSSSTYFHHWEVQTLGVHLEDLIPVKHLQVIHLLCGLGKIASGLYASLENKLENLRLES